MTADFHITVGTHPLNGLSVKHDIQILKASLLYADRVRLCSLTTSMLILTSQVPLLGEDETIELLMGLARAQDKAGEFEQRVRLYKQARGKQNPTNEEVAHLILFKSMFDKYRKDMSDAFEKLAQEAGAVELAKLIQSGLVEIKVFTTSKTDDVVREFFDTVKDAVTSSETYPLFDDQTGTLLRYAIQEGKITLSEAQIARGKHIGLSANLLERLPLFDRASVAEIIDIRKELQKPLIRFRAAIIDYSEKIKNAPWDTDFTIEADQLFHQKVAPAVLEIEELCRSNRYLNRILKKGTEKYIYPLANLGVLLSTLSGLVDITQAAYGTTFGATVLGLEALREWQQEKQRVESNQLYFYYRARERLKKQKKR